MKSPNRKRARPAVLITLTLATLPLTAPTQAQQQNTSLDRSGLYLGGNYGGYKSRGGEFDDKNDFFGSVLGYRFTPFLGVEGFYNNFGEFGNDQASADVRGYGLALKGYVPIGNAADIYLKAGKFYSNVDVDVLGFEDDFDNDHLTYGLGVNFILSEPLSLSVEYSRYQVRFDDSEWPITVEDDDTDIDTLTLGFKLNL